jgi:endonuclease/exonuclease/phosphatase family metal-dependent hydrolase
MMEVIILRCLPLTLITFNAGLLRAFGGLFQPAPFVAERRAAMPRALAGAEGDMVVLQEVYGEASRGVLSTAFRYAAYDPQRRSSLMALSSSPIHGTFVPFHGLPFEERLFDRRGVLIVERDDLVILDFHATAGGIRHHPESAAANAIRGREVEQLLDLADRQSAPLVVIAGDLNAGPDVSEANYRQFETCDWVDVYALLHPESRAVTWDPRNPLNSRGPHKTSRPQRVDHLFVRRCDLQDERVTPTAAEIIFTDATVRTSAGPVTLSDHYAVRVHLTYRTGESS